MTEREEKKKTGGFHPLKIVRSLSRAGKIMLSLALIAVLGFGGVFIYRNYFNTKPAVDTEYILSQLQKDSELTTARLTYQGFTHFEDGGGISIPLLNRKNFYMLYQATARAGIDIQDVQIDNVPEEQKIIIRIPKAKILDVNVDPATIEYIAEDFALFNTDDKQDANRAQVLACEKAREELSGMGILESADQQSEALMKGLVMGLLPEGYGIEVRFKEVPEKMKDQG